MISVICMVNGSNIQSPAIIGVHDRRQGDCPGLGAPAASSRSRTTLAVIASGTIRPATTENRSSLGSRMAAHYKRPRGS